MKQMKVWVLALLCLAMLCSATSAATLYIDPVETELGMGQSADLAVMVEDVQHLGSYDFGVTWDPVLVTLTEVQPGPLITTVENIQSGEANIAGLCNNETLDGISGNAALCYLTFTAIEDNGATSPIEIIEHEYGFLNSTTGTEIPVESITNGSITVLTSSVVDARIALANRQVPADQETNIRASVANQRNYATALLDVEVTISKDSSVVNTTTYPDVVIQPGETFSREIPWTPGTEGTYLVKINVTSDDPVRGSPTDQKTVTAIDYQLYYTDDVVYGPDRAQVGNWFYDYVRVTATKAGTVNVHIDAPDGFEVWGGADQTAYLYNSNWNYLYIWMRSDEPGSYAGNEFTFNISANGKGDSVNGKDITIYVPSIEVTSVNSSRITSGNTPQTMQFNTLHTNNTHQNETVLVAQSGAQGRTLSGLSYLVRYPYGCVEQTTCQMLASLNVKNYYLGRTVQPTNFADIREEANESVSRGIDSLIRGGTRGQNSDGGWSLWGGDPSESSSSSYASYTLAKINQTDEDLNRLLDGKISYGEHVDDHTVNFEKLIEWFHDNPDDPSSGAWYWSAPVCHSWTPESNTAFVMVIHDMINQTANVQQPYRGYMEENMQNATRYLINNQQPNGAFSSGDDAEMATGLGLWGLESFALPSATVTEADIADAKERAKAYLIGCQNADGSWYAPPYYGWYTNGRTTESTAYAIIALNATGMENDNATIADGVGWLVNTYENSGSWGYTWASQAAIDALIVCQGTEISAGNLEVYVDGTLVHTFVMSETNPREEYTLTADQMAVMMANGVDKRTIDEHGMVKYHEVEGVLIAGDGPIALSVENSQWAPLNEIDSLIRNTHTIQMEGDEEGVFIPQICTDIEVLADAEYDVSGFTVSVNSNPSPMVVDTTADVTVGVISDQDLFAPMIEVPIEGFAFDNTSEIVNSTGYEVSYEILNSTANIGQESIFIEPESWVQDQAYTYTFGIVPDDYGTLNMSLRIIPMYDDTNVAITSHTFDVTGTGNVTIYVQNEDYAPVIADVITVDGETVLSASTGEFADLMEGTYAFSVNKTDFPDVHGNVTVTYGETAVYNVTIPTTMTEPVLILSEGGSGSIAGVAQIPAARLSAVYVENSTYNVSVMGDGGELGVALQFPMRYLFNDPVVTLNGVTLGVDEYELIPGAFEYNQEGPYYTTNATLIVYNATSGMNYIGMEFEGDVLGDATGDGVVTGRDSLFILNFVVGNIIEFDTYDYADVVDRDAHSITGRDALFILNRVGGYLDQYYQWR